MADDILSGIYTITNTVNGKVYVGSSIDTNRRIRTHKRELVGGKHCNEKLQRAWNKYGESEFVFEVIEIVETNELLVYREQHWLDEMNSVSDGYNILPTAYSMVGRTLSDECRKKISEANKGKLLGKPWTEARRAAHSGHWKGRSHTEETLEKMRAAQTGKVISEAQRKKISENNKNRPLCSDATRRRLSDAGKGRVFSEETRAKISEAHTGKVRGPHSEEHREKISQALVGKKKPARTPGHTAKIASALTGVKREPVSDETKEKQSVIARSRPPEHYAKMVDTKRRNAAKRKQQAA